MNKGKPATITLTYETFARNCEVHLMLVRVVDQHLSIWKADDHYLVLDEYGELPHPIVVKSYENALTAAEYLLG